MFNSGSQDILSLGLLLLPFLLAGINIRLAKMKKLIIIVNAVLALVIAAGALGAYLESRQEKRMIADTGNDTAVFANMLYMRTEDGYHHFTNKSKTINYVLPDSVELPAFISKGFTVRVLLPEGDMGETNIINVGDELCLKLPDDCKVRNDFSGIELTALIIGFFAMAIFNIIRLLLIIVNKLKEKKA